MVMVWWHHSHDVDALVAMVMVWWHHSHDVGAFVSVVMTLRFHFYYLVLEEKKKLAIYSREPSILAIVMKTRENTCVQLTLSVYSALKTTNGQIFWISCAVLPDGLDQCMF